jgi:hypothetical protein
MLPTPSTQNADSPVIWVTMKPKFWPKKPVMNESGRKIVAITGHDAWIVGDETCKLLDFGGLKGYAQAT